MCKQLRQISSPLANSRSDAVLRSSSRATPGGESRASGWRWPIGALYRLSSLGEYAALGFGIGRAAFGCAVDGQEKSIELSIDAGSPGANIRTRIDNVRVTMNLVPLPQISFVRNYDYNIRCITWDAALER
jgi:hypothetical protein